MLAAAMAMQAAEIAPTGREIAACTTARTNSAAVMARWTKLSTIDLAALNAKRKTAGQPAIECRSHTCRSGEGIAGGPLRSKQARAGSRSGASVRACASPTHVVSPWNEEFGGIVNGAVAMSQDQAGATFIGREFGHYRITRLLGRGGTGEVYLAEDTRLGRKVALKFLPASLGGDDSRVRRFEHEALAVSALNHPNILTVYEFGTDQGQQFLATEFVDGRTLREALHSPTIVLDDVLRIAEQAAFALSAAHKAGIVHRDIKPENIMLREDGVVKVLDFGIAKLAGTVPRQDGGVPASSEDSELDTRARATIPGSVLGTVVYMSPEQARGKEVDERTDVWSLGVVIYEMLAGAPPFVGETSSDVIASILRSDAPPLVSRVGAIPRNLERIVERALCKNREERYPNIKDLLIDLRNVQRELDVQTHRERDPSSPGRLPSGVGAIPPQATPAVAAGPIAAPSRPASFFGRHRRLILSTAGAVAALLVALGAFTYSRHARRGLDTAPLRPAKAPLTGTPMNIAGDVLEAAISPDGRLVAYVLREGLNKTAYVQSIAIGGHAVAIAPPTETGWHGLSFAPDSSRLFLLRNEPTTTINELYEVRVTGGPPRKVITDVDSIISFGPGGDRFVFRRDYPDNRESSIILANVDGSGERKLSTRQIVEGFINNPVWSPDGRTVACLATNPIAGVEQQRSIVVINVADGSQKMLGQVRWRWTTALAWAPDGGELLLIAKDGALARFQVWRVGYPGGEVLNATNDLSNYSGVSVTTDDSALFTMKSSATAALFVAPAADLKSARRVTSEADVTFNGVGWTPDGKILYGSSAGGHRSIWVMRADGSVLARLTNDEFVNDNPVATPDGRYVIYQSERAGYANIWRMNADGSDQKQLTFGHTALNPSVTPDSRWIVYVAASVTTARLWKVSVDGGNPEELTASTSYSPVVSPDGKSIAFSYVAGGAAPSTLSIVSIGGGNPYRSFRIGAGCWRWEPGGAALFYVDGIPGRSSFMRLPFDTGVPTPIAALGAGYIPAFDLSRDGKRVVFIRITSDAHVVMIRNFR